jgi:hypothetical protein
MFSGGQALSHFLIIFVFVDIACTAKKLSRGQMED